MLTKSSCEIATNLALMLFERNKNLTPAAGSLMQELSTSSYVPMNPESAKDFNVVSGLPNYISATSEGSFVSSGTQSAASYVQGNHDVLMDNYIDTISKLVSNHVQFARSVVYTKAQCLQQEVESALHSHQVKQPEDFFEVSMFALPEVLDSELIATEVLAHDHSATIKSAHIINFGEAVNGDFDLKAYVTTGDDGNDSMVRGWMDSVGVDKLRGYLFSTQEEFVAAMSLRTLIEYSLVNFVFYRSLTIRQDLGMGISSAQLVTQSADNRDFFAQMLKGAITSYQNSVKQGVVLDASSEVNFSYLSNKRFSITLYKDSFLAAQEQGATLEQVFGHIAAYGNSFLTVEDLKKSGSDLTAKWNSIRALYLSHILSERDVVAKMALKMKAVEVIYKDAEGSDGPERSPAFQEETAKLINKYVEELDAACLDKLYQVCIDIVAGIAYRDTASACIINEMVSLTMKDASIDPGQAALIATVKYVADFLIEQVNAA